MRERFMKQQNDPLLNAIQRFTWYLSRRVVFALLALGCQQGGDIAQPNKQELEKIYKRPPVEAPAYGQYAHGYVRSPQRKQYY